MSTIADKTVPAASAGSAPPADAAPSQPVATSTGSKVILHHLNNSRSQRILWLLEELGVDYEIKEYKRLPTGLAPPELFEVNPTGKSPVVTVEGRHLAESGAIVEYLIQKFGNGRFRPQKEDDKLDDLFFAHFAEGSAMNWLVMKLIFTIVPKRAPFLIRPVASLILGGLTKQLVDPNIEKAAEVVKLALEKHKGGWIAGGDAEGNPTAADFQMMFVIEAMNAGRLENVPEVLKSYRQKIHSRPAYIRGNDKGGKCELGRL